MMYGFQEKELRWYLSGPMTGYPEENFPAFHAVENELRRRGYANIENPAHKGVIPGWTWEDYLRYDIEKLMKCQGIAMLDRWELSRGARLEHHIAMELDMRVMYGVQRLAGEPVELLAGGVQ